MPDSHSIMNLKAAALLQKRPKFVGKRTAATSAARSSTPRRRMFAGQRARAGDADDDNDAAAAKRRLFVGKREHEFSDADLLLDKAMSSNKRGNRFVGKRDTSSSSSRSSAQSGDDVMRQA